MRSRTPLPPLQQSNFVHRSAAAIERLQPRLNAFIEVVTDGVRSSRSGEGTNVSGALSGWTVGFKDMFARPGRSCTYGARLPLETPPAAPATAVSIVEGAGGITMGFLNMSEFALGPTGHNATFGHCHNPWSERHVSGGSSSGAASAVAAGLVRAAIGSDTGGSIRIPAACCGVVGLKPTHARIGMEGTMPLSPSLDCIGPIAKTAADCEILFETLCGPACDTMIRAPFNKPTRLLWAAEAVESKTSPEIFRLLSAAVRVLGELGYAIEPAALPDMGELHRLADVIQSFESFEVHAGRLRQFRGLYTPHVRRRIEAGRRISAEDYFEAISTRPGRLKQFLASSLRGAGALVLPTIGHPIPTIEETDEERVGGIPDLVARMTYWTRWLNYLGVPALSLPCGFDDAGNPVGMQLVGAPGSESALLGIGRKYQSATRWHEIPPPLFA